MNATRFVLLGFYIFKGEKLWEDYSKLFKPWTYMAKPKRPG